MARLGAVPTADRRPVAVDLRYDWPTALVDAGFDPRRPAAWIAEGLFGYLPPDAQDRLLDNITGLSAKGSRLASEAIPDMSEVDVEQAREMMRKATARWREHGFELEFADLGYQGERNDVAAYLDKLGWRSSGTPLSQLLSDNGFAAIPQTDDSVADSVSMADTTYYTSVLSK